MKNRDIEIFWKPFWTAKVYSSKSIIMKKIQQETREAVFQMKHTMQDTLTPAAVQGAVARDLAEDVLMTLSDQSVISRSWRHFRTKTIRKEVIIYHLCPQM